MKTGRYSLAELLDNDNIEHIIIPEMQRDYVWQPLNVERLLGSIKRNFDMRLNLKLDICEADGTEIPEQWEAYLSREYQRLKYNTRIGFIYAYYDGSDSSSLYLIDGQQRITTLFLVMLALYSQLNEAEAFCDRYFKQEQPKLDYKVRETAHRFLVDFIRFMLKHPNGDFAKDSEQYYGEYRDDPTVKAILENYRTILKWVKDYPDKTALLEYIENFIEFNYFDTGLSRQGERLYLYMNSRGEQLSMQEQIRPTIISRCGESESKLEAGRKWERWQDFYWKNRGKNRNADPGFLGFLKLAVVLHQQKYSNNIVLKPGDINKNGRSQSVREIREDYIRHPETGKEHEQENWILQYVLENMCFDFKWLDEVFRAVERVSKLCDNPLGPVAFVRNKEWKCATSIEAVNYIPLCSSLLMVILHPDISDENLYRLGMYMLNRSDVDSNSKNVGSTIRAMELVESLDNEDIRKAFPLNIPANMDYFGSILWKHIDDAGWEKLFWELVANKAIDVFFDGDHDLLMHVACPDKKYDLNAIEEFIRNFEKRFFNRRNDKNTLSEILEYGDISQFHNTTANLGELMEVYRLPTDDSDWLKVLELYGGLIHNYVVEATKPPVNHELKALSHGLKEMSYGKYLYSYPDSALFPNIIIALRSQIKTNLVRDLPAQILHENLYGSWCWNGNYHSCVLDFAVENGEWILKNPYDDGRKFALEFFFKWDVKSPIWEVYLKIRLCEEFDDHTIARLKDLASPLDEDPSKLKFHKIFTENQGYLTDGSLDSIKEIVRWVDDIKPNLTQLLD